MHIAVYAIAKNEVGNVERFVSSCQGADLIMVADTGSTDGTIETLERSGATVHHIKVQPWRFDDARNASLALLPADVDVCVALDIDEVLNPGWAACLRAEWRPGTTRARYLYTWSHQPDGSPQVAFFNDKIHARFGYRWRHACHEALYADRTVERFVKLQGVWVDHWPDRSKSRSYYLPLLEQAVREDPHESRHAYCLGREYAMFGRHLEAEAELRRYLSLPDATFHEQTTSAMRLIATARRHAGHARCLGRARGRILSRRRLGELLPGHRPRAGDEAGGTGDGKRSAQFRRPSARPGGRRRLADRLPRAGSGPRRASTGTGPERCALCPQRRADAPRARQ
jgi:glycosyltransferase involved in cell wall biosynthesis